MTILDLVRIMRTNLKLLLLSMLLGIVVAAGYTLTRPVEYQATSTAQIMAGASNDASAAMVNQQLANQRSGAYAQLASGSGVADRVVALSKGALSPGDFVLVGAGSEGTSNLSLTASSSSAAKAQQAANLAPAALSQEIKHIETLNGAKSTVYDAYPLSRAGLPASQTSPKWPVNLLIGAFLGLVAGTILVVLRKQLDSRIRHTSDLEKVTGVGTLGVIPKAKNLQTKSRGGLGALGSTSEAFRMLRTNLRYVSAEQPPRSLVITSAVQSEGKSTVASNLARVLAAAGQHVVLVDTDLRRPVIHETFDVDNAVGLTEVLTGQASLRQAIQPGDHKNLSIITSGRIPPNPSELLGSRRMSAVIDALEEEYFVVLDAPPLLPVTDAGLLSVAASGAAVVYHHGTTHKEQIALCTKILDQVGAHYFGSILNMTPPRSMGSTVYGYGAGNYATAGYGYGYGYGYGHTDESDEASALTPAHGLADITLHAPESSPAAGPQADRGNAGAPFDTTRHDPMRGASSEAPSASANVECAPREATPATSGSDGAPPSRRSRRFRANDDA